MNTYYFLFSHTLGRPVQSLTLECYIVTFQFIKTLIILLYLLFNSLYMRVLRNQLHIYFYFITISSLKKQQIIILIAVLLYCVRNANGPGSI